MSHYKIEALVESEDMTIEELAEVIKESLRYDTVVDLSVYEVTV